MLLTNTNGFHIGGYLMVKCFHFTETAPTQYGMELIDRTMLDNTNYIILLSGIPFESDGYITGN